jgi:hypothetical protein
MQNINQEIRMRAQQAAPLRRFRLGAGIILFWGIGMVGKTGAPAGVPVLLERLRIANAFG